MLKIYEHQNPKWGIIFKKIAKYLREYKPSYVTFVDKPEQADIQIVHLVGYGEVDIVYNMPNPVVWLHAYESCKNINWLEIFDKVLLGMGWVNFRHPKFFRIPLGYDEKIFYPITDFQSRKLFAFVTGHVIETECIDMVHEACVRTGFTLLHTGEDFSSLFKVNYIHLNYMPENVFAQVLNQCRVVFGLRKVEGFEQAVLEGIACGANGVVPSAPSYNWYDNLCFRVNLEVQNPLDKLCEILEFSKESRFTPLTSLENFTWETVITQIYDKIIQNL